MGGRFALCAYVPELWSAANLVDAVGGVGGVGQGEEAGDRG